MTRDDIIRMAKETGLVTLNVVPDSELAKFEHFYALSYMNGYENAVMECYTKGIQVTYEDMIANQKGKNYG